MDKHFMLIGSVVALALISTSAPASEPGAFFINGDLGQSHFHDSGFTDKTDTSSALRAGYRWNSDRFAFGVEAGYVNLGTAKSTALEYTPYKETFDVKGKGPLAGVNARYTFADNIYLSGRAGWFRSKFDVRTTSALVEPVQTFSNSYQGDGSYAGVGAGYNITPNFGLGVAFDDYHGRARINDIKVGESVGVFSGVAELRF